MDATEEADMRRIVIMGAGGRDFHDFNVVYRSDPDVRVVAFTAAQIPGIDDREVDPEAGADDHERADGG